MFAANAKLATMPLNSCPTWRCPLSRAALMCNERLRAMPDSSYRASAFARLSFACSAVAMLWAPTAANGQEPSTASRPPAPAATASEITAPPSIDGRLDEAAWSGVQVLSGLVQREPYEGTPVSEPTEVRLLYDDDALYVGAWLYDSEPSALVFGQTLRDASLNESDAFVVVLDTYRDGQNGFAFGTTPAGIEYDGQFTNEGEGGGGRGGLGR